MQLLNGVRNCLMLISRLLPKRLAHPICHSVASFSKRASRRAIKMASTDSAAEATLQQAIVKSAPSDDHLQIALVLAGKRRLMDRPKSEALQKTLARMQKNAMPPTDKKQKRKKGQAQAKGTPEEALSVILFEDGTQRQPVDPDLPNLDAWRPGRVLQIGESRFLITYNPPTAEKVQTFGKPLVGCPIVAAAVVSFAPDENCKWQWYRGGSAWTTATRSPAPSSQPQQSRTSDPEVEDTEGSVKRTYLAHQWQVITGACSPIYIPTADDKGLKLRVQCTPARSSSLEEGPAVQGQPVSAETVAVVGGPATSAAAARHARTGSPMQAPGFRAVTYNILADQYASSDYAQTHLFAYCPSEFMEASYRRPLIAQEVLRYNPDIVCLQEVDEKAFFAYFYPVMKHAGFEGRYTKKAGKTAEGSATFFRTDRYRAVALKEMKLNELFADIMANPAANAIHSQFLPFLQSSPNLVQALSRVTTIAQLTVLEPVSQAGRGEGPVCLLNTHLFFHPNAPHIRTLHVAAMLAEAHVLAESAAAELGMAPTLLFCGDLNSDINDGMPGALELLQKGELPANHWDWECGAGFRFRRDEDMQEESSAKALRQQGSGGQGQSSDDVAGKKVHGVQLRAPYQLRSADDLQYPFSNYVRGYTGLLDYVWYEPDRLEVQERLRIPSAEELQGWIPSQKFPSDHLSLVFDFNWRPSGDDSSAASTSQAANLQAPLTQTDAAPNTDPTPKSIRNAAGEVNNKSSMPTYHSNGIIEQEIEQRAAAAAVPANSEHPSNISRHLQQQQQQQPARCFDGPSPSAPAAANDTKVNEGSDAAQGMVLPADPAHISAAATALGRGEIVAVPTDTLYGLAACANNQEGMDRIYHIKHRQAHIPLAICVADVKDVARFGSASHLPDGLLDALLPGAVTVILSRRPDAGLCPVLNPGFPSIGIRVPDSDFIRGVCRAHGGAIVLTSANISGGSSPTNVTDFQELWHLCAAVFDAGQLGDDRAGSTIIDLSQAGSFRIVREGSEPDSVRHVLTRNFSLSEQWA